MPGCQVTHIRNQENSFKNRECIQKEITKEFSVDTVENVDVSDTDYVRVIGYLVRYKWEGQESCNCYSHEKKEHDEHIYLCSDPDDQNLANTVVCEITRKASPELRAMNMHELIGKMVAVEGYAFIDPDHTNAKWRKTAFEVHPVVDIKVLN